VGETTTTVGETSTTVAGASTTVQAPTRVEAGGGGTAQTGPGWQVVSLLGAIVAGLGALALIPRKRGN
jgi:hypothetical protein